MQVFLGVMTAVAFIAGGAGLVLRFGTRDESTSWYPWPSPAAATTLLTTAAVAAGLAFVAWLFTTLT